MVMAHDIGRFFEVNTWRKAWREFLIVPHRQAQAQ